MDNLPEFLNGEECERCRGPLLAEGHKTTRYVEQSWDYVSQTVHICYACGHSQTLSDAQEYFEI